MTYTFNVAPNWNQSDSYDPKKSLAWIRVQLQRLKYPNWVG